MTVIKANQGQVLITTMQMQWTTEVTAALIQLETPGAANSLKKCRQSYKKKVENYIELVWCLQLEVLLVVLAFFLEVFDRVVNLGLELLIAFLDDEICLIQSVVESGPCFIKTFQLGLIFVTQL